MADYKTTRGALLEKYGAPHRWARWGRAVKVIDARPRRDGHYLGWQHADLQPGEPEAVRWISETNFQRFYRRVQE